jgi:hypothetical protein
VHDPWVIALGTIGLALVLGGWASYFTMIAALRGRGHAPLRLFFREHYRVYTYYRALVRESGAPRWPWTLTFAQIPGALLLVGAGIRAACLMR